MENLYTLGRVQATFAHAYTGSIVLEISMDGKDWKRLSKEGLTVQNRLNWSVRDLPTIQGRFLRLLLDGRQDVRLSDVQAFSVERK